MRHSPRTVGELVASAQNAWTGQIANNPSPHPPNHRSNKPRRSRQSEDESETGPLPSSRAPSLKAGTQTDRQTFTTCVSTVRLSDTFTAVPLDRYPKTCTRTRLVTAAAVVRCCTKYAGNRFVPMMPRLALRSLWTGTGGGISSPVSRGVSWSRFYGRADRMVCSTLCGLRGDKVC